MAKLTELSGLSYRLIEPACILECGEVITLAYKVNKNATGSISR